MLRILNKNKEPVCALDRYKQLRITKKLQLDDKTLEFNALIADISALENEGYIETETDRFVIKEIRPSSDGTADVLAQLDVETLEGKTFVRFESVEKTLSEAMAIVFAGTGWTVGTCGITKRRTLRKENCTAFDMLKQALSVYRCECVIDSRNMTVSFYEEVGSDRGVYFMSDLNLRSLTVSKTSYDFYTEIEPYGANGMTIEEVNDGSKVLTNYTYSTKKKRIIWKDERYSVPESLMEDALAKLNDYSKPYVSYMADVVDLASMSSEYSILEYGIGDTITLVDNATETREKQRIVEMVVYPEEPELNSCVFANTTLSFEELATKFSETADTVDNITIDNGTIDGKKINGIDASKIANFDTVLAASAVFGELVANQADFEEATVDRFEAAEAAITTLQTNYAEVAIAKINVLESDYAHITHLLANNAAATQVETINLSADNATIDEAFLKDLIALHITANDLKAGTIYTNKHTVQSQDNKMVMDGSRLIFKDDHDVIRIQLGKDGQGNYNYYLANENGDIVWDAAGITKDGVPNGLIVDDMVAGKDSTTGYNGISPSKLDIHSMVGALNEEGGLKSSSIVMDEDNQSLTVAFSNLKSNVDNMSFGGRNLIKNTLNPDVSTPEKYPRLIGQTYTNAMNAGSAKTVAEHGIRVTNTRENRTYVRFGGTGANGSMNGLVAGETYTLSFDAKWKLFKKTIESTATFNFRAYLYDDRTTQGTFANNANFTIGEIGVEDRGEPMSGRCEFTFDIPNNVTMLYLQIQANSSNAAYYADDDYIELCNLKLEKGNRASDWSPAPEDLQAEWKAADAAINAVIGDLQDQIDGVVDTYYYAYAPTLNNIPASDWASTDYPAHKGDMFLDTSTGKSYRFLEDETTHTWLWKEIPDTATAEALRAAQDAKDLADHKRRVFVGTATPAVPYDVGDLWFEGEGGDIKTCTNAKTSEQIADTADWSKLHKYTDDTYASNKYAELTSTIDSVTSRVGTLETTTTSQGNTIASHTSTLEQTATKLSAIITDSQISELDSGTNMYDKLLTVKETADGTKTEVSSIKTWKENATGQISTLESNQTTFTQNLNTISGNVSSLETNLQNNYKTTTQLESMFNASREGILLSVSETYATQSETGALDTRLTAAEEKITDEAIISTVSASYGIADANLIYNSTGFGSSTDGWMLSNASTNYELLADYSATRPGKTDYALGLRIKTTSTTAVYMRQTDEHNIPVVQGKQYTLSGFYYRGSNVKTGCQIGIEYGNNGSGWTSTNSADYNVSMTATGAWTAFSLTFTAPKNTVRVAIKGAGSSSTTANNVIYVCDLVLVRGTEAMPWAEQPVSLIQQSADMIRLQAEKLVWVANNSSLTEAGYLTVTGAEIGGFTIDDTTIRTGAATVASSGNVLLSSADGVTRYINDVSRDDVRFAIGTKFGVDTDGRVYASDGVFSGEIDATSGEFGGIRIASNGIVAISSFNNNRNRLFSISNKGEISLCNVSKMYSPIPIEPEYDPDSGEMIAPEIIPYDMFEEARETFFYLSDAGALYVKNLANPWWKINSNSINGSYKNIESFPDYEEGTDDLVEAGVYHPYDVGMTAPTDGTQGTGGWAIYARNVIHNGGSPTYNNAFLVRYNGHVDCSNMAIAKLSSGTGSTIVANSSGELYKSSSSKRFKEYLSNMTETEAEKLYDLPVVEFKYKDGYLNMEDEAFDKPLYGFFAEDVTDLMPDSSIHDAEGYIENYTDRAIIARLVKVVQIQHQEIESLKASMQS